MGMERPRDRSEVNVRAQSASDGQRRSQRVAHRSHSAGLYRPPASCISRTYRIAGSTSLSCQMYRVLPCSDQTT